MEIYPLAQLTQALSSVLFGAALGLLYDVLRAFRRVLGVKSAAADLVFCLCTLCALFYLGMSLGEGQLRIFMTLFSGLGCALYLGCVTPFMLPPMVRLLRTLLLPLKKMFSLCKKVEIFFKKGFQSLWKWFRIKLNLNALPARETPRGTSLSGEECLHGTQNRYDGKAASSGGNSLCPAEPHIAHGRAGKRPLRPRRRRG